MRGYFIVGLGAGIVSALILVSAAQGSLPMLLLLNFLTPLPLFLASFGWGWPASLVSAISGSAIIGVLAGGKAGVAFLLGQAVPVVLLCHLVYLSRSPDSAGADDTATATEWYPIGRVLAAAAIISGVLAAVTMLLMGADLPQLKDAIGKFVDKTVLARLGGSGNGPLSPADRDALIGVVIQFLPLIMAASGVIGLVANMWLAGKITLASGRLLRPWPDLAATVLPPGFSLLMAVTVALTFVPGMLGLAASGLSGGLLMAYALVGLAIIHYVTRGKPTRGFILWAVYAGVFLLNTWAVVALAMIGLSEPFSPLKRRLAQAPPPD